MRLNSSVELIQNDTGLNQNWNRLKTKLFLLPSIIFILNNSTGVINRLFIRKNPQINYTKETQKLQLFKEPHLESLELI